MNHEAGSKTADAVSARFRSVLETFLGEGDGTPAEPLADDARLDELGLTSVDYLELLLMIEKEFGVEIPQEALLDQSLVCVKDWVSYLEDQPA